MRDFWFDKLMKQRMGKSWDLLPIICLGCYTKAWFKACVDLSLDLKTIDIPFVANKQCDI
jgi:hypothetical protein